MLLVSLCITFCRYALFVCCRHREIYNNEADIVIHRYVHIYIYMFECPRYKMCTVGLNAFAHFLGRLHLEQDLLLTKGNDRSGNSIYVTITTPSARLSLY
jgi:hypothetical protein